MSIFKHFRTCFFWSFGVTQWHSHYVRFWGNNTFLANYVSLAKFSNRWQIDILAQKNMFYMKKVRFPILFRAFLTKSGDTPLVGFLVVEHKFGSFFYLWYLYQDMKHFCQDLSKISVLFLAYVLAQKSLTILCF